MAVCCSCESCFEPWAPAESRVSPRIFSDGMALALLESGTTASVTVSSVHSPFVASFMVSVPYVSSVVCVSFDCTSSLLPARSTEETNALAISSACWSKSHSPSKDPTNAFTIAGARSEGSSAISWLPSSFSSDTRTRLDFSPLSGWKLSDFDPSVSLISCGMMADASCGSGHALAAFATSVSSQASNCLQRTSRANCSCMSFACTSSIALFVVSLSPSQ
mmetsp:Transcript_10451/g.21936  ORF Transcript_10451/g.21936 Transcript_10451/m.21936 type:complete len:220 (-) Transcript_10451:143-802(-)